MWWDRLAKGLSSRWEATCLFITIRSRAETFLSGKRNEPRGDKMQENNEEQDTAAFSY